MSSGTAAPYRKLNWPWTDQLAHAAASTSWVWTEHWVEAPPWSPSFTHCVSTLWSPSLWVYQTSTSASFAFVNCHAHIHNSCQSKVLQSKIARKFLLSANTHYSTAFLNDMEIDQVEMQKQNLEHKPRLSPFLTTEIHVNTLLRIAVFETFTLTLELHRNYAPSTLFI